MRCFDTWVMQFMQPTWMTIIHPRMASRKHMPCPFFLHQDYNPMKNPRNLTCKLNCNFFPITSKHFGKLNDREGEFDFLFLADIISDPNIPEFGGYHTGCASVKCHASKVHTKAVFAPLIYMVPTEPTTDPTTYQRNRTNVFHLQ